jgi:hypothetical protein
VRSAPDRSKQVLPFRALTLEPPGGRFGRCRSCSLPRSSSRLGLALRKAHQGHPQVPRGEARNLQALGALPAGSEIPVRIDPVRAAQAHSTEPFQDCRDSRSEVRSPSATSVADRRTRGSSCFRAGCPFSRQVGIPGRSVFQALCASPVGSGTVSVSPWPKPLAV